MQGPLERGFQLDRRWHWLRGEMLDSKKPDLLLVVRVLHEAAVDYAIIGGIALQIHQAEPRTTLAIDLVVVDLNNLPREQLQSAGFRLTGSFTHSQNWLGPSGSPVQFTDDSLLADAISRAAEHPVDDDGKRVDLKILAVEDLLHAKLRAATDDGRRRSKRMQDLADAQALIEEHPHLEERLSDAEKALLGD